jgi:uncharacterized protein (TIGR02145 family)
MVFQKYILVAGFLILFFSFQAQTDWSIEDLHVVTFRNGDPLMEANSESNWKFCNSNQIPAYFKLGESIEDGVLYNYYAIKDERQLAPVGYSIPELDDVKSLATDQFFQSGSGGWKTSTGNGYFNADPNGYLPFEGETMELLSQGDAAYYWTMTAAKALHSMGFVILNGEKGYSLQEMRRENFCAVRCVKNESEATEFKKSEEIIIAERTKKQGETKIADEKLKKVQSENKNILGGSSNINSTSQNGELLIWISSDIGCGKINVTVNNITKTITNFYPTEPSCDSVGCAVFNLPPGEYNVDAECKDMKWSFTRKVVSNECNKTRLKGKGQLMIWISSDLGCGQIEVTVNGITQMISSSYKSAPDFGAKGCANFTLPSGEYNITAKCNNMTWSFTKKVTSEECTKTELIKNGK